MNESGHKNQNDFIIAVDAHMPEDLRNRYIGEKFAENLNLEIIDKILNGEWENNISDSEIKQSMIAYGYTIEPNPLLLSVQKILQPNAQLYRENIYSTNNK